MKTFFILFSSIFTTVGAFAKPFSSSNCYINGFGGFNFLHSKNLGDQNSGYVVGGAFGYRFSNLFRLEVEGAYRENSDDGNAYIFTSTWDSSFRCIPCTSNTKTISALINGLIDIPLKLGSLTPYFGIGLGESFCKEQIDLDEQFNYPLESYIVKVQICGFAYQGILGLTFWKGGKIQTDLEYRYFNGWFLFGNHTIDLKVNKYF